MLYDPKWDFIVEIKPTLDGFIKWLELQPAGATYFYSDLKNCALGQYYRSLGLTPRLYDEEIFPDTDLQARMLFDPASLIADAKTTFGFALKNLRAMRSNENGMG